MIRRLLYLGMGRLTPVGILLGVAVLQIDRIFYDWPLPWLWVCSLMASGLFRRLHPPERHHHGLPPFSLPPLVAAGVTVLAWCSSTCAC